MKDAAYYDPDVQRLKNFLIGQRLKKIFGRKNSVGNLVAPSLVILCKFNLNTIMNKSSTMQIANLAKVFSALVKSD